MTILNTTEGGRRVCTTTQEVPTAPQRDVRRLHFDIEPPPRAPWYVRFPIVRAAAAIGVLAIAVFCTAGFVVRAVNSVTTESKP